MRFKFVLKSIIIILLAINNIATAQTLKEFEVNTESFIKEFNKYLSNSKRSDLNENGKLLELKWKDGSIDNIHKVEFIETINLMLKRKMRPSPYINNYMVAYINCHNSRLGIQKFIDWNNGVNYTLTETKITNQKKYKSYINSTIDLFKDYTLFSSRARTWRIDSTNLNFDWDKDSIPVIIVEKTTLKATTTGDSITLVETQGTFYPIENKWLGKGGQINWEKVYIDPTDAYAVLYDYKVDLSSSEFKTDSVLFSYKSIFSQPLIGKIYDKLIVKADGETNSYPRFQSIDENLEIKNIAPNVNYQGGLALHGSKVIGMSGVSSKYSNLLFYKDDSLFIKAKAKNFIIKLDESIISKRATTSIYLWNDSSKTRDSIHHPGIDIRLNIPAENVMLLRGQHGIGKATFYNSFHQYEMDCEVIEWKLKKDNIEIKIIAGAGQTPAVFESVNYYKDRNFKKYQATLDYNPLSKIKMYLDKNKHIYPGNDSIPAIYIAQTLNPNLKVEHINRLLFKLVEDGFIYYDIDNEMITVREKVINYVKSHAGNYHVRHADKIDYDVIRLEGITGDHTHANIDLLNNNRCDLIGVNRVHLSDSQNVMIIPNRSQPLKLKANRDFDFLGKIKAGYVELYGEDFSFKYADFKLDLDNVDSFRILIPTNDYDKWNKPILRPLETLIEDMKATLNIDFPKNKSGLRKKIFHTYPQLASLDYSYAYYDKQKIQNGIYDRKEFYFRLDTFLMDSLNNLNPEGIVFDGTLFSSDIFYPFKEKLRVQNDWSLGFLTETGDTGFTAYQGKGKYNDTIFLSNAGLRGSGNITYVASNSYSTDILFLPDSMYANTETFVVHKGDHEGVSFPAVDADTVFSYWKPYKDTMYVRTKGKPFTMYDGQAKLSGVLMVTPWGLFGAGQIDIEEATISSNSFKLNADDFSSENMKLEMKSPDLKLLAIYADSLKGVVNMAERTAHFESQDPKSVHDFPYSEYVTNMNVFDWSMDEHQVALSTTKKIKETFYRSIHKKQDSLQFTAETGLYHLDSSKSLLEVFGIPYIPVAEAHLFPDSNLVRINPHANMNRLKNAIVKADTVDTFHTIYGCDLLIGSKYRYKGSGTYDYINKTKVPQKIQMGNIWTKQLIDEDYLKEDEIWESQAKGTIEEDQKFELNPKIGFKGSAYLYAPEKFLTFEGYSKIYQTHPLVTTQWFSFTSLIDPNSMLITIKDPKNEKERPLHTGFFFKGSGTKDIYYNFLNTKINEGHHAIFEVEGLLEMNEAISQVTIGDPYKIQQGALKGNKLDFNDSTGMVYAEGHFDLGMETGLFNIESNGNCNYVIDDHKFSFDLIQLWEFHFSDASLEIMMNDIRENTHEMPNVNYDKPSFMNAISEFLDDKKVGKLQAELKETGTFTLPPELDKQWLFTEVQLTWDSLEYTYKSTAPIGIGFIGGEGIHKRVIGYLELGKKRSGDYMNLYFQAGDKMYYFNYKHGNRTMVAYSSNREFNNSITDVSTGKRKAKVGKESINFQLGSKRKAESFLDRMLMEDEDF